MGKHEDSIPENENSDLYPQELQLKLYQAFIFSIPILFSIILCLLFYLFYLKRRAHIMSPHNSTTPSNHSLSLLPPLPPWKDKLHVVVFDEELRARDSICCVCLGEFEMKEELWQLPLCKHVFHGDCIRHWLRNNATCPLCRCSVISTFNNIRLGLGPTNQENNVGSNISRSQDQHVIQILQQTSSSITMTY